MRDTFPGVSATMQVMAVSPYTLSAVNVFRSACAPAPALLSEPAIVRATAVAAVCDRRGFLLGIGFGGHSRRYRNLRAVAADGLDRAAFHRLFAERFFLGRFGLFVNVGVPAIIVATEI